MIGIERVEYIISKKNQTVKFFCETTGFSTSTFNSAKRNRSDIKLTLLQKLIEAFPDTNPHWLITGEGEPFIKKQNTGSEAQQKRIEELEKEVKSLKEQLATNNVLLLKALKEVSETKEYIKETVERIDSHNKK